MNPDPITPADLRAWMKRHNISRTALAEALMISKGTVDNWFCQQAIGKHRQKHLRTLMEGYDLDATAAHKAGHPDEETAFLADASIFTPQELKDIEAAACLQHMTSTALMKKIFVAVCKEICQTAEEEDS